MKMKRSWLLGITGGIGVFMILYTLVRQFTGFTLGDQIEKQIFDGIFIVAIVLFMMSRKMAADERKAAAEAKKGAPEAPESGDA
jgi:undecaprenyl pyrophosphate phosphatase UppP